MTECAVILAGGQANRMGGGDKGRLMLGDQSLSIVSSIESHPQVAALVLKRQWRFEVASMICVYPW